MGHDHTPYRGGLVAAEVERVTAQEAEIVHCLLLCTCGGGREGGREEGRKGGSEGEGGGVRVGGE